MTRHLLLCTAICVTVFGAVNGIAVVSIGRCPNIPTKEDFNLTRYLGAWYSLEQFDSPFQLWTTCVKAEYTLTGPGEISVVNSGFRDFYFFGYRVSRTPTIARGKATVVDSDVPGGLYVRFGNQPGGEMVNYKVVDTDYDNYSVVYSCSRLWFLKTEIAWILTRQRGRVTGPTSVASLKQKLTNYGVEVDNFKRVRQSDCSSAP